MATTTFRERMLDYDGEVFGSTASEILRYVRSTRPRPADEDVEAHIEFLDREGLIAESDLRALRRRGYRV
jgi:hypothetical protein